MLKKSRANFQYKIGEVQGLKMLLIVDKDAGSMSVTNDIENVVADISTHEGIDPTEYFIAYKDSQGDWDGWDAKTKSFFFFRNKDLPPAHALALTSLQMTF